VSPKPRRTIIIEDKANGDDEDKITVTAYSTILEKE